MAFNEKLNRINLELDFKFLLFIMKIYSLFIVLSFQIYAQNSPSIFYYDVEEQKFKPINSKIEKQQLFGFSLKADNFYDYLKIEYRENMHLFIDGVLKHSFKDNEDFIISIDSLRGGSVDYKDRFWLLFLEDESRTPPLLLLASTFESARASAFKKPSQPKSILFWGLGILILAFIGFSRFQKKGFLPAYFSDLSHISNFLNKEKVYHNLKTVEIIFFIFFFSLLFAVSHALWWEYEIIQISTSTASLIVFGQVWLLGVCVLILRFAITFWLSKLYHKKELFLISNNLFIHFSYGFQVLCLAVLLIFNFTDFNLIFDYKIGFSLILTLFSILTLVSLLRFFTIPIFQVLIYFFFFELTPIILIAIYIFKN